MPVRRHDTRFQRRNVLRYLACLLIPATIAFACPWEKLPHRFIAAGAAAVGGWFLGKMTERAVLARYRCPACGTQIGGDVTDWNPGREIIFYCEKCGVEWDTGVSSSDTQRSNDDGTYSD